MSDEKKKEAQKSIYLQYDGKEISIDAVEKAVRENYDSIKKGEDPPEDIRVYLKPEDRKDHPEAANVHYADCLTAKKRKQKTVTPAKVSSNPDYLSVDEAALMAGADRKRVFRWIRGDRFPVVRSGKKLVRIPRKEFESFLSALHTMED